MKSDIEISQQTELKPICDVAQNLGILNAIQNYGLFKAKIDIAKIHTAVLKPLQSADQSNLKKNKLVLVTSINPTAKLCATDCICDATTTRYYKRYSTSLCAF